uniref:Uncharacterized protein n=1 Tax=Strongyloides venezuelensis TaxID=75913 RepID=A0A0K0G3G4_STRVS
MLRCFFENGYMLDDDNLNDKDKISPCKNFSIPVQSFEEFVMNNVPDKLYGANDIIDLVMCRGVGLLNGSIETIKNFKDTGICERHINELVIKKKLLNMLAISVLKMRNARTILQIKVITQWKKKHALISKFYNKKIPFLGSPLCKFHYDSYIAEFETMRNCVTLSEKAIDKKEEQESKDGNMNLRTINTKKENETLKTEITRDASEFVDSLSEISLSTGTQLYTPSTNNLHDSFASPQSENSSNVRKLLREVFREWNLDIHFAITESGNSNDQYFARKITGLYTFITKLTKELFMDQEEIALIALTDRFKQKFMFNEEKNKFLNIFKHHYRGNEKNSTLRNTVVSVFSSIFTFKDLKSKVDDLTRYQFHIGRRINIDPSLNIPREKRIIQRVPDNKIEHFIEFLTSPTVSTVLPYDEKKYKVQR